MIERPREQRVDGITWRIRPLSDVGGLTRMGAKIREVEPGMAGTHLHFHDVEEEWSYVLSGRGRVKIGPLDLSVLAGHFAAFARRQRHALARAPGHVKRRAARADQVLD